MIREENSQWKFKMINLETAIQALLGTEYSLQGELLPNYRQEEERQPEHK